MTIHGVVELKYRKSFYLKASFSDLQGDCLLYELSITVGWTKEELM